MPGWGLNLCPSAPKTPPIPLPHSRNSHGGGGAFSRETSCPALGSGQLMLGCWPLLQPQLHSGLAWSRPSQMSELNGLQRPLTGRPRPHPASPSTSPRPPIQQVLVPQHSAQHVPRTQPCSPRIPRTPPGHPVCVYLPPAMLWGLLQGLGAQQEQGRERAHTLTLSGRCQGHCCSQEQDGLAGQACPAQGLAGSQQARRLSVLGQSSLAPGPV